VQPIERQNKKHDEVGNHHRQVEAIGVVDARKGAIGDFVPVMAERTLRGQQSYERWSLHDSLYADNTVLRERLSEDDYSAKPGRNFLPPQEK
jgi:hypothetical protein